jgi:hypothetical protein
MDGCKNEPLLGRKDELYAVELLLKDKNNQGS